MVGYFISWFLVFNQFLYLFSHFPEDHLKNLRDPIYFIHFVNVFVEELEVA